MNDICWAGAAYSSGAPEFNTIFDRFRVSQSLVFLVALYGLLSVFFVVFHFCHCTVCPSINGFWLPFLYLHTFLTKRPTVSVLPQHTTYYDRYRKNNYYDQTIFLLPVIKEIHLSEFEITWFYFTIHTSLFLNYSIEKYI